MSFRDRFFSLYDWILGVENPQVGDIYKNHLNRRKYRIVSTNGSGYKVKNKASRTEEYWIREEAFMLAMRVGLIEILR